MVCYAPCRHSDEVGMGRWIRVAKAYDIPAGEQATVDAEGTPIAIFNIDGVYHAISDICIHLGASLGEGWLDDHLIICPWHGWRFDVRTGASDFSDQVCIKHYEVTVKETELYVHL